MVRLGTWETEIYELGSGKVRGMSFDPTDERLALSDEDEIHILDLETGLLTQSIPIAGVSDFHWLDNETVVVGTNDGRWLTISLSVEDLIEAARNPTVARVFTKQECAVYNIDPCPPDE